MKAEYITLKKHRRGFGLVAPDRVRAHHGLPLL